MARVYQSTGDGTGQNLIFVKGSQGTPTTPAKYYVYDQGGEKIGETDYEGIKTFGSGRFFMNPEDGVQFYDDIASGRAIFRDTSTETADTGIAGLRANNAESAGVAALRANNAESAGTAYDYINRYLYEPFLGRTAESEDVLRSYAEQFGPYVDADEAARFIQGALDSGEITQEQANQLLNQITGTSSIEPLYQEYLGRPGDIGGLTAYTQQFGSTIEPEERIAFIEGAVGSGEITRAQADALLASLRGDTGGAGGGDAGGGGAGGVDLSQYDYINALYQQYLGRPASQEELQQYAGIFGPTIESNELRDFILGAVSSGERDQNWANALLTELGLLGGEGDDGGGDGGGGGPGVVAQIPAFERQQPSALTFEPLQRGLGQLRPAAFMPGLLKGDPSFGGSGFAPEQLRAASTGLSEADRAYLMDVGGVSPAELASALGIPMGQIQGEYNLNRPGGLFSTTTQGARGLPEDFVLQTGAYAQDETGAPVVRSRAGGMVNYQEGGKVMPRLSAEEAGSRFDVSEFIDEQGRLVGGYSRPVYDENQVIVGYEYTPYERDVVLNPRLREAQARTLDTEQAMLDMLARQGRTGVSPTIGGLPGIMPREAVMRRRPDYNFAEGGLASVAQDLASRGRFGDTMVAHINPQEAMMLKAMGGSGTINPETGLPEFFFDKIFGRGKLIDINIGKKSQQALAAAAGIASGLGYIPSFIPGLGAVASTGLIAGGIGALGNRSLSAGLQLGLSAYGAGKGTEAISSLMTDPSVTANAASSGTGSLSGGPAGVTSANVPVMEQVGTEFAFDPAGEQLITGSTGAPLLSDATVAKQMAYTPTPEYIRAATAPATEAAKQGFLERTLPAGVKEYTPDFLLEASGPTLATGAVLGGSLIAGQQERAAAAAQQAAINREREDKKKRFADLASRLQQQYPFQYAKGGVASLAGGGMTYMEAGGTTGPTGVPRDVTGTGDGMSDSVPATIEGVQEARLADGEFVIPADVVADIGNGSSDAGSKKLYDMMDRIRKARHGTTEQPPEIKAERLMPA